MFRRSQIFGFYVWGEHRFRIGDKKYSVGAQGIRVIDLLTVILEHGQRRRDHNWLLPLRPQIREIEQLNRPALLIHVIERTRNPLLRLLAIWLRGRCGGTIGTSYLATLSQDPNQAVRKEVARALKRMRAWAQLRTIAEHDPDPKIRRRAS